MPSFVDSSPEQEHRPTPFLGEMTRDVYFVRHHRLVYQQYTTRESTLRSEGIKKSKENSFFVSLKN